METQVVVGAATDSNVTPIAAENAETDREEILADTESETEVSVVLIVASTTTLPAASDSVMSDALTFPTTEARLVR